MSKELEFVPSGLRPTGKVTKKPVRLRLSRKKGFRLQEHSLNTNGLECVNVARPSKYGNPFSVKKAIEIGLASNKLGAQHLCKNAFDGWLHGSEQYLQGQHSRRLRINTYVVPDLKGKNLACWCALDEPCHADVLLDLANRKPEAEGEAPQTKKEEQ